MRHRRRETEGRDGDRERERARESDRARERDRERESTLPEFAARVAARTDRSFDQDAQHISATAKTKGRREKGGVVRRCDRRGRDHTASSI